MKYLKHIFENNDDNSYLTYEKVMKDLQIIETIHKIVKHNIEKDLKDHDINKIIFHLIHKYSALRINYDDINDFSTEYIRSNGWDLTKSKFLIVITLDEQDLMDDIQFKIHMKSIEKRFEVGGIKDVNYDYLDGTSQTAITLFFDVEKSFESMYKAVVKMNK
jgi:hypothetical protein